MAPRKEIKTYHSLEVATSLLFFEPNETSSSYLTLKALTREGIVLFIVVLGLGVLDRKGVQFFVISDTYRLGWSL